MTQKEPKRFKDAEAEIEQILQDLENEGLDVDEVAQKVERAYDLIRFCNDRIRKAKVRVEQIEASFRQDEPGESDPGQNAGDLFS